MPLHLMIQGLLPIPRPSLPVDRWPLTLPADVRAIADSTRVLPEVLERLAGRLGRLTVRMSRSSRAG